MVCKPVSNRGLQTRFKPWFVSMPGFRHNANYGLDKQMLGLCRIWIQSLSPTMQALQTICTSYAATTASSKHPKGIVLHSLISKISEIWFWLQQVAFVYFNCRNWAALRFIWLPDGAERWNPAHFLCLLITVSFPRKKATLPSQSVPALRCNHRRQP